jgi:hypothetical protein
LALAVAVAALAAACSNDPTPVAEPVTPTATATATAAPSPTPIPTPTPIPLTLTVTPVPDSGLVSLAAEVTADELMTGVYIDGVLRSVSVTADVAPTAWVPVGEHQVCVAGVRDDAEPVLWDSPQPPEPMIFAPAQTACALVEGTVDAPPRLLPDHRIVAYYGAGVTPNLGVLGHGTPEQSLERVVAAAKNFEGYDDRPVIPAYEYIVTVAQGAPGPASTYSAAIKPVEVWPFLKLIRSVGGVMFLDIQPGRSSFIYQVTKYEELLREPDVHLALDPEWSLGPNQTPTGNIGHTDPEAVGVVMEYLDQLVNQHGLPPKVLILHQFRPSMIERRDEIVPLPTVSLMIHVDGQGSIPAKHTTWGVVKADPPWFMGFKVFFRMDTRLMSPDEVMALEPRPDYVSYQ